MNEGDLRFDTCKVSLLPVLARDPVPGSDLALRSRLTTCLVYFVAALAFGTVPPRLVLFPEHRAFSFRNDEDMVLPIRRGPLSLWAGFVVFPLFNRKRLKMPQILIA
jgi:hypothetical protein